MKKKIFICLLLASTIASVFAAKMILVEDSCKRCKISDKGYVCGRCGSSMSIHYSCYDDKCNYYKYTFICKNSNCNHSCIYKQKTTQ